MMFCVKCGKEETTFDGLCIDCFLNGKQLASLPHYIDLERCASCEEFHVGHQWLRKETTEAAKDAAENKLAVIPGMRVISIGMLVTEQDERNFLVKVDAEGELSGNTVTALAETVVRIKNNVCQRCSRQLGNYYEATLQIRSGTKELSDQLRDETVRYVRDRIENMGSVNRQIFLTKVEEVQGGVDMLLSSISLGKSLAKELADMYGAETKEAAKLIGKTDDGSDMYRLTYLVRMPEYHLGDVVIHSGRPYKLIGISKGNGRLIGLEDFHETSIRRSDMHSLKVHTKKSDLMKATVVSKSKNEVQILHPSNYSTIDIKVPADAVIGDSVDVADVDDTIFYVP